MGRTLVDSDTTLTDGTEQTLVEHTTEGDVLDALIDLSNMAAGDAVEVRVYAKILNGGAYARVYYDKYTNAQTSEAAYLSPVIYVPPMTCSQAWKLTIKRTAGTDRNYYWAVFK